MAYTPISWEDYPSVNTPVSASNLNHMDTQIKTNADDIEDIKDDITTLNNNLANKLNVATPPGTFTGDINDIYNCWDTEFIYDRSAAGTLPTDSFLLITIRSAQIAIPISSTVALYRRIRINGAWTNWLTVTPD